MVAELAIRGGTVVDGTGRPRPRGRRRHHRWPVIEEIGPDLHGERELDASGCVVAPGFIDIHTHYDAQVFWDPALRPLLVTTGSPRWSPATADSPSPPPGPSTTT